MDRPEGKPPVCRQCRGQAPIVNDRNSKAFLVPDVKRLKLSKPLARASR